MIIMHKSIVLNDLPRGGPYAHAVIAGETVFISGQTGLDEHNRNDFTAQFKSAMEKINKIAEYSGKSISNIAKINVYVSDKSYFKEMNEVFGEYFKENPPARTTLVAGFVADGILVEIDATLC